MKEQGEDSRNRAMRSAEFVAFVAAAFVIGALATDLMLPALAAIDDELRGAGSSPGQAAIGAFLLGMGLPQLLVGPIGDRYGRRPVFLGGGAVVVVGNALGALAPDVTTLIAARLLQGFGAGALRVATYSMVRDRNGGPELARVLSLAMAVLLLEPIVAPMIGQVVLLFGSWRLLPVIVAGASAAVLGWGAARLPESLSGECRRSMAPRAVLAAYRQLVTNRQAIAPTLAYGLAMGAHIGFLASAQGIFQLCFDVGLRFTPLLALVSLATAAAAFINVRLVRGHGSARLVRFALLGQFIANGIALAAAEGEFVGLTGFLLIQSWNMFAFGLLAPNLTVMAMSPFGHVAGTAASMFGFATTSLGALLGFVVGHLFDGSVRPLLAAYSLLSAMALLIVAWGGSPAQRSVPARASASP